jgi:cyclase
MRGKMRRSTFLCSLALAGSVIPRRGAGAQVEEKFKAEQIRDDLYILIGRGCNVAVLTTEEGVILVDDKRERYVDEILAKVGKITDKPIRYVISTHRHGDHVGGNPRLMATAEIVAHENTRAGMVKASQPGLPRLVFTESMTVFLGGKEVRVRHYGRGHTDGDLIVYFPAHRVVHMGDLLVEGAPALQYGDGASGVAWTATLDRVLALDFDTVIPGHGVVMKKQDLAAWNASFKTVCERIRQMLRERRPKAEIAASLKVDDLAGWKSNEDWTRSLPGLIDELAQLPPLAKPPGR